jgi:TonB family protein
MHASTLALALGIAAAANQGLSAQSSSQGQEVRVCGEVKTVTATPPACDPKIRVTSAGDEFDVVIPIAVANELSLRPHTLVGAQACFTGRSAPTTGIPQLQVASKANVEILSTSLEPGFGADATLPCGSGVTMPRVIKERKPQYTQDTMRAKVQGTVEMQAVVNPDGTVTMARVIKSLHPDLDEQALLAVKQWRFDPGTRDGRPVPVLVTIEMTFTLRSNR